MTTVFMLGQRQWAGTPCPRRRSAGVGGGVELTEELVEQVAGGWTVTVTNFSPVSVVVSRRWMVGGGGEAQIQPRRPAGCF